MGVPNNVNFEEMAEKPTYQTETRLYRKIPVVVEAYQTNAPMIIHTLEGDMKAYPGDWIITGVEGEMYPCKNDIFKATYEEVKREEK